MTRFLRNHAPFFITTLLTTAWIVTACSKKDEDSESAEGSLGSTCDLEAEGTCEAGLTCSEDTEGNGVCTVGAGQPCDPDDEDFDNGGCALDSECAVPTMTETAGESLAAGGATSDEDGAPVCLITEGGLCDPEQPHCSSDLTCAETTAGDNRCFGRVVLRGGVSDTSDASPIGGALVLALDEEGSAVTDIAVSQDDGTYLLDIPVVRDEDGNPTDETFTLNAAAQDYQPFPSGVRVALPILADDAVRDGNLYVIESALTDIGLIALPAGERAMASGTVAGLSDDSNIAGLLIVATGAAGTFTAITDLGGTFTLFNLPDGEYEVKAYGKGVQIDSTTVTIDGAAVEDVALTELDEVTATVSGQIQIVDGNGFKATSVILVVEDTFDPDVARGSVPRGLRAPESGPVSIDGEFSISGVPAGTYVALAAYENDGLVRDPNENIAGTDFVTVTVTAGETDVAVAESFKITGSLTTVFPGVDGPEAVTEKPMLEWEDDAGEDWYDVRVFDAFGDEVWTSLNLPSVSGSATATVQYEGPLEPGMYYQFRVQSWSEQGNGDSSPISNSEDLRGVFFLPAP